MYNIFYKVHVLPGNQNVKERLYVIITIASRVHCWGDWSSGLLVLLLLGVVLRVMGMAVLVMVV